MMMKAVHHLKAANLEDLEFKLFSR
jgi:hypothetical protein